MTRTKLNSTRRRRVKVEPGTYADGDYYIKLTAPATVDVVERYRWRYTNLKENNAGEAKEPLWFLDGYLWDTVDPPFEGPPEPPVVKLPWWRRWFGGARVPPARVVT